MGKYFLIDKIIIILHGKKYQHTEMKYAGCRKNRAAVYYIPKGTGVWGDNRRSRDHNKAERPASKADCCSLGMREALYKQNF